MTQERPTVLHAVPALEMGGTESQLVNLARWQAAEGFPVHVCSTGGPMEEDLESAGVRTHRLAIKSKSPLNLITERPKINRLIDTVRPDIVQVHSRVPAWHFYFATRGRNGCHFLTRCGGPYAPHFLSRVMIYGERVLVNSEFMKRHLLDNFQVSPEKIRLVNESVAPEFFSDYSERRAEIRSRLGIGEDDFAVGMTGRFSEAKRWQDLIAAAHRLEERGHELHLILVGEGKTRTSIASQAQETGLADRTHLVGFQEDVHHWLSAMDIFVLTSERETVCAALVEALAAGLPAVTTPVGAIPDYLSDGENGLIFPVGDSEELAERIARLLQDSELRGRLGEKARETARERFSIESLGRATSRVYDEVLSSEPSGAGEPAAGTSERS